ncbi:MAG TPA: hypothetical protein VFO79_05885, partial [Xanthomonadales bacterium]|nr:hypothetical protein [Xanthomonadales bacterium]
MNWAFGLIGLVIGAAFAEFAGAVGGFATGWLFGTATRLRTRIDALEKRLATASGEAASRAAPPVAAAPQPLAATPAPMATEAGAAAPRATPATPAPPAPVESWMSRSPLDAAPPP